MWLGHFDSEESSAAFVRYGASNLLDVLLLYKLHNLLAGSNVIVNAFCSGLIDKGTSGVLPVYLGLSMRAVTTLSARLPEKARWIARHESHGQLLAFPLWDLDLEIHAVGMYGNLFAACENVKSKARIHKLPSPASFQCKLIPQPRTRQHLRSPVNWIPQSLHA